ncbi:hypothetical protein GC169_09030 [bacterium]|nr:hypothetical protein [bacterium]
MPVSMEAARAGASAARRIAPWLAAEAANEAAARRIARLWPAPHSGFRALDTARRAAVVLASADARFGGLDRVDAETWSLRRLIDATLADPPAGLVEAFRKLDPGPWRHGYLAAILAILRDAGQGAKVVRHARAIDAMLVRVLGVLPDDLRRPRIVQLIEVVETAHLLRRGAEAVARSGPLPRVAERLERARSVEGLFRMLIAEIGLERLAPPPIPGAAWLRPLASIPQLKDAALRFENCLVGRIPVLLAQMAAYYEVIGDEPAIVEIVRSSVGLWQVGEVRGHANAPISLALWTRVRDHLQVHGAMVKRGEAAHGLAAALAAAAGW